MIQHHQAPYINIFVRQALQPCHLFTSHHTSTSSSGTIHQHLHQPGTPLLSSVHITPYITISFIRHHTSTSPSSDRHTSRVCSHHTIHQHLHQTGTPLLSSFHITLYINIFISQAFQPCHLFTSHHTSTSSSDRHSTPVICSHHTIHQHLHQLATPLLSSPVPIPPYINISFINRALHSCHLLFPSHYTSTSPSSIRHRQMWGVVRALGWWEKICDDMFVRYYVCNMNLFYTKLTIV